MSTKTAYEKKSMHRRVKSLHRMVNMAYLKESMNRRLNIAYGKEGKGEKRKSGESMVSFLDDLSIFQEHFILSTYDK